MNVEIIQFDQTDENEFTLGVLDAETGKRIALRIDTHEAVRLYDVVRDKLDGYISERNAARREYETGIADDPAMQPLLDRIKHGAPEGESDTSLRPRPGETPEDTITRVVSAVRKEQE